MKLTINQDPRYTEPEVVINCRETDPQVLRIIACAQGGAGRLTGSLEGRTHLLEPGEVYYCESVDKRTFLYARDKVYESPLRLREVEARLAGTDFFRAGKALLVNLSRVDSLLPVPGGRILVAMESGEKLMVSRQYVPLLKGLLGL